MAKEPGKKQKTRKKRTLLNVTSGVAHIQATFNNTIVSTTDTQGNVVSWSSAGQAGFTGSRKSTAFAAQLAAEQASKKALDVGMKEVRVYVKGPGAAASPRFAPSKRPQRHAHPRRHPDSTQRLPRSEAPPRITGLVRRGPCGPRWQPPGAFPHYAGVWRKHRSRPSGAVSLGPARKAKTT